MTINTNTNINSTSKANNTSSDIEKLHKYLEEDIIGIRHTVNLLGKANHHILNKQEYDDLINITNSIVGRLPITVNETKVLLDLRSKINKFADDIRSNDEVVDINLKDIINEYKNIINNTQISKSIRGKAIAEVNNLIKTHHIDVPDIRSLYQSSTNKKLDDAIKLSGNTKIPFSELNNKADLLSRTPEERLELDKNFAKLTGYDFVKSFIKDPSTYSRGGVTHDFITTGISALGLGSLDKAFHLSDRLQFAGGRLGRNILDKLSSKILPIPDINSQATHKNDAIISDDHVILPTVTNNNNNNTVNKIENHSSPQSSDIHNTVNHNTNSTNKTSVNTNQHSNHPDYSVSNINREGFSSSNHLLQMILDRIDDLATIDDKILSKNEKDKDSENNSDQDKKASKSSSSSLLNIASNITSSLIESEISKLKDTKVGKLTTKLASTLGLDKLGSASKVGKLGSILKLGERLGAEVLKYGDPIGWGIIAGLAAKDLYDGYNDDTADRQWGNHSALAKFGSGLANLGSGLTLGMIKPDTFVSAAKSIYSGVDNLNGTFNHLTGNEHSVDKLYSDSKASLPTDAASRQLALDTRKALIAKGFKGNDLDAAMGQIAHESGDFKYSEELANGKAYEGRKDLGNINEGDGVKYKGRGVIQITGRSNYERYGKELGIDLVNHPELASDPKYAPLIAAQYMADHKAAIDKNGGTVEAFTKAVNGGYNGLDNRIVETAKWKALDAKLDTQLASNSNITNGNNTTVANTSNIKNIDATGSNKPNPVVNIVSNNSNSNNSNTTTMHQLPQISTPSASHAPAPSSIGNISTSHVNRNDDIDDIGLTVARKVVLG